MSLKPPRPRLPSLNALRAFEVAARCGSFVKAADELGVTPGAVTQQIRQFEAWFGHRLFERRPHGVVPTAAALEALPRLTRAFDTLAQAVQALRSAHDARMLSVAALPCIAQLWLSPRLATLQDAFPGLQISVSAMEQPPDPHRDPHDIAIFYCGDAAIGDGDLALRHDAIMPVCTPALAARLGSIADLSAMTLLHDAVWRHDWARWLAFVDAPQAIDPSRGPSFSLYSMALDAALSGSGVLIGRLSLVERHLAEGRLCAPFGDAMPTDDRLTIMMPATALAHTLRKPAGEWLARSA